MTQHKSRDFGLSNGRFESASRITHGLLTVAKKHVMILIRLYGSSDGWALLRKFAVVAIFSGD